MRTYKLRTLAACSGLYKNIDVRVKKDEKEEVVSIPTLNVPVNSDGSPKLLPIDQFNGKRFLRNKAGWPMNDIMAYEEAQNDSIARAVLQRINVIKSQDAPVNRTDQEIFDSIIPSNYSSPAEYLSICEKFGRMAYIKAEQVRAAQAAAAAKAAKAAKNTSSKTVTVEPE